MVKKRWRLRGGKSRPAARFGSDNLMQMNERNLGQGTDGSVTSAAWRNPKGVSHAPRALCLLFSRLKIRIIAASLLSLHHQFSFQFQFSSHSVYSFVGHLSITTSHLLFPIAPEAITRPSSAQVSYRNRSTAGNRKCLWVIGVPHAVARAY